MSRTDVHRPWRVQVVDPYNRHLLYRWRIWPWKVEITSFRNMGCGCGLCTNQSGRKVGRRRYRHELRAVTRDAVKVAAVDRDGIDIAPPRRSAVW